MIAERLMPDPQPHGRPGILTREELAACLTVLRALEQPVEALLATTWDDAHYRAWLALAAAGYVESDDGAQRRGPMGWAYIRATPAGLKYLEQLSN